MREGPAQAQKDIDVCLTSVGKSWMQSPTEYFSFCHAPQITDISPLWKQCIFLSDGQADMVTDFHVPKQSFSA